MDIPCPDRFDFIVDKWPAWKQRFLRFRQASDLVSKMETRQINMLLFCMGEKVEDIYDSFALSTEQAAKFDIVLGKFDSYFVIKRNLIFERAKFNLRRQEQGETIIQFITSLHKLSEYCDYGPLRDDLIRDRIVVGISYAKLSQRMQLDEKLTLEKATHMARQAEQIFQQQEILRGEIPQATDNEVNALSSKKAYSKSRHLASKNSSVIIKSNENTAMSMVWSHTTPRSSTMSCTKC